MKHSPATAFALALTLAVPAIAQERLGSYTMPDGQVIPEGQNRSPAGHDGIAFRPNCDQVVPIGQGDTTAWTLAMPDGMTKTLATYPGALPGFEAQRYLANDGLCVWGGAEVPITYTSMLPQQARAEPQVDTTGETSDAIAEAPNTALIALGGAMLLGAIGLVGWLAFKHSKAPATEKASGNALSRLEDALLGGLEDDE